MRVDDFPNLFETKVEIGVGSEVAEAVDCLPSNVGVSGLERLRQLASRLGERLETPQHRLLEVDFAQKDVAFGL
jgi:hypothetical protein